MYFLSTEIIDNLLSLTASEEVSTFEVEKLQDPLGSARWRSTSLLPNIVGQLAEAAAPDCWGLWYANAIRTDWARLRMADTQGNLTAAPVVDFNSYLWPGAAAGFHGALSFSGTGDVDFGDVLDFGASDSFTVEMRVYFKSYGDVPMSKGDPGGIAAGYGFWNWESDSKTRFAIADGVAEVAALESAARSLNSWRSYAAVIDRSAQQMRLYVDGVLDAGPVSISAIGDLSNANNLYLARRTAAGRALDGYVDELRIWSVARSAADIAASYDSELDVLNPPVGLELYYRANEGTGTAATDESGNARNGTITGGTWINVDPPSYPDLSDRPHVHQRSVIASPASASWFRVDFNFTGNSDGYVQGGALFLDTKVSLDFHQWEYLPETRGLHEVAYAAGGLGRGGGMGKRGTAFSMLNLSEAQTWGQLAPLLWERQEVKPVGVVLVPSEATYPMDYIYYGYPSVRKVPEKRYFGTFEVDVQIREP